MNTDAKKHSIILAKWIQPYIKRIIYQSYKADSICNNQLTTYHIKSTKKNHMTVSIEEEKKTDNIQYPFMIKTCSRTGVRGNFLNLIKDIYKTKREKPCASRCSKYNKAHQTWLKTGLANGLGETIQNAAERDKEKIQERILDTEI